MPTLKVHSANIAIDSLVSSHVYEIIRTIYTTPSTENTEEARISVLQQTLSQLRLTNIATLDACMNHFTRLVELTTADEDYVSKLATALSPCILRPRTETSLTMEEKHSYRLIRDLFAHKDAIFSELKRMSTLSHSTSVSGANPNAPRDAPAPNEPNRPRAISTDESNRKAHMEERTRALLEKATDSRSRAPSPGPSPRAATSGHRRDRSVGGPETRFPIVSPTATHDARANRQSFGPVLPKRASLDVPPEVSLGLPQAGDRMEPAAANGIDPPAVAAVRVEGEGMEKRNSLGRNSARFVGGRRVPVPIGNQGAAYGAPDAGHGGVTLVDAPMDD